MQTPKVVIYLFNTPKHKGLQRVGGRQRLIQVASQKQPNKSNRAQAEIHKPQARSTTQRNRRQRHSKKCANKGPQCNKAKWQPKKGAQSFKYTTTGRVTTQVTNKRVSKTGSVK